MKFAGAYTKAVILLTYVLNPALVSAYSLDVSNLSVQTPPVNSEHLASRLWINITVPNNFDNYDGMNQVQALGATGVRVDLPWKIIEKSKGQYDFSQYDKLVKDIKARNLKAIFILDYSNSLYFPSERAPNQQSEYQAFARFAAAVATRYSAPGIIFEIWNEPNSKQFWPPAPNAEQYGQLVRETVNSIHKVKPGAQILLGGTARADAPFVIATLKAAGGTQGISALAIHPYYDPPEVIPLKMFTMKQQLLNAGIHLPLWDGESGYSSGNYRGQQNAHSAAARRRQGIYVIRKYLAIWSAGIAVSVLYNLHDISDDGNDSEVNFGLLDNNFGPNPSFTMLKTLTDLARERTLQGKINNLPDGIQGLLLDGDKDNTFVLWQPKMNKSTPLDFFLPRTVIIQDILGQEKQGQWCKAVPQGIQCTLTLSESNGPIYLRLAK